MTEQHAVIFAGAGPGDPELLTIKARNAIDCADIVIYAGSLVNPAILDNIKAEIRDSSGMNLDEIMELMIRSYRKGLRVVRLHTGDPAIYSATGEQMRRLDAENIPYVIIPGVTSAFASAAAIRAELTLPDVSQTVILTRISGRTPVPDMEKLSALAAHRASMCIYLSVSMIDRVVKELEKGGYSLDTPVIVAERTSWPDEQIIHGTLRDIKQSVHKAGIRKTAMILVGNALRGNGSDSMLYSDSFTHEYRQRQTILE